MESAVVSDTLKELLAGKQIIAGIFTTFSFEPEFFELEVIPLLLSDDIPFSTDPRVKSFQVREALRESGMVLDVFYDLNHYRREGQTSPAMEYGCHGVHRAYNAFHGKVVLLLAYDEEEETECLFVGAGSNNLTRAGWWDNIEGQHWEVIYSGDTPSLFLNQLREDVEYLDNARKVTSDDSALDRIDTFLSECRYRQGAGYIPYYNLNHINKRGDFTQFLSEVSNSLWSFSNWTLEIISPYFAEQSDNREHEFFFDLGVRAIHIFLPTNQEGEALVDPEYLRHINDVDGIEWADWSCDAKRSLGIEGKSYRRLHAKIYHFYNKKQAWVFVGSVNFSRLAMKHNVEAGFMVKLHRPAPLLQPLKNVSTVNCSPPEEAPPGLFEMDQMDVPPIQLSFDWKTQSLHGALVDESGHNKQRVQIQIISPERRPVIEPWSLEAKPRRYNGDTAALEELLATGSLVKVRDVKSGEESRVMLQQTGWSHKPLSLPDLTAEQILAIYADLSPEKRQLLLMNAKIRALVLAGEAGEMTVDEETDDEHHFFSEYAEIFHAFRQLKTRLLQALEAENLALVDYYLTGKGVDSLPTLIAHTQEDDDNALNPVTAYLVLLSAREIYRMKAFRARPLVKDALQDVERLLKAIKASDRISLKDNSPEKRARFFAWYEKQFSKDYKKRVVQ